jgi:hypothetical protein
MSIPHTPPMPAAYRRDQTKRSRDASPNGLSSLPSSGGSAMPAPVAGRLDGVGTHGAHCMGATVIHRRTWQTSRTSQPSTPGASAGERLNV